MRQNFQVSSFSLARLSSLVTGVFSPTKATKGPPVLQGRLAKKRLKVITAPSSQTSCCLAREPVAPGVEKVVRQPEMRPGVVKPDIDRRGPWVINLLSSRNQDAVNRFSANARAKDIPVTQTMAQVKGTQYWRAQLTGFATANEAKSYAEPVKRPLGLKEVWIFRGVN
jgi:hypothetical protein